MVPGDIVAYQEGTHVRRWMTRGVAGVGATSLLSDAGHEFTTSLLPSLITSMGRRARRVLAAAARYVPAYALLATSAGALVLVIDFLLSRVGIGFGETAQTAWLATVLQDSLRADGFGVLVVVQAFGDLGATVVAGVLWAAFSAPVAFRYADGWMALAMVILLFTSTRGPAWALKDSEGER
jgi:hypothetical protein